MLRRGSLGSVLLAPSRGTGGEGSGEVVHGSGGSQGGYRQLLVSQLGGGARRAQCLRNSLRSLPRCARAASWRSRTARRRCFPRPARSPRLAAHGHRKHEHLGLAAGQRQDGRKPAVAPGVAGSGVGCRQLVDGGCRRTRTARRAPAPPPAAGRPRSARSAPPRRVRGRREEQRPPGGLVALEVSQAVDRRAPALARDVAGVDAGDPSGDHAQVSGQRRIGVSQSVANAPSSPPWAATSNPAYCAPSMDPVCVTVGARRYGPFGRYAPLAGSVPGGGQSRSSSCGGSEGPTTTVRHTCRAIAAKTSTHTPRATHSSPKPTAPTMGRWSAWPR